MAKRITQETFEEVVKENIDEFDMEMDEAIKDAIKQFQSQSVDLTEIDFTCGRGKEEVLKEVESLKSNDLSDEAKLQALSELLALNHLEHELGARNQVLMRNCGGMNAVHALMQKDSCIPIIKQAMLLLVLLSKTNVDNRDFFEPNGSKQLCGILKWLVEESLALQQQQSEHSDVILAGLSLARYVAKSENNKVMLMRNGMGDVLVRILTLDPAPQNVDNWSEILSEACHVLKGLTVHDDIRKEMSCAYDNGKVFLSAQNLVPALMTLSLDFRSQPLLASAALSAAKNLVTTEEAVFIMTQHGAMGLPRSILGFPEAAGKLVKSVLGFMRNLCADDQRKEKLVNDGSLQLMVAKMSDPKLSDDVSLVEHGAACLAAMSLRSPSNSERIVECGAVEVLVNCMRKHPDRSGLQRQGALCVRNIAARCPQFRTTLLDAGVENVLRAAGRLRDAVDESYGALRDLQLEVQMVKITEEGRVEAAFEQFGAQPKLNFNPIYDDTPSISQRVQEEARAPFAKEQESIRSPAAVVTATATADDETLPPPPPASCGNSSSCGDHNHSHERSHEHSHDHSHEHEHNHDH